MVPGLFAPVLIAQVGTCYPVSSCDQMPVLTHAETLLIGAVVAPALFAASIWLTRARGRQILGGVAGAAAYGLTTFTWDQKTPPAPGRRSAIASQLRQTPEPGLVS